MIRLAREANQRGWWAAYGDTVPDWVRTYLDLEQDASELWAYERGSCSACSKHPPTPADMNCVHLENAHGALYLERPTDVDGYTVTFEQLSRSALPANESLELMTTLTSQLQGERPAGSAL